MATPLNIDGLTLNPKESTEFQKFIFELAFNQADLSANHRVWTGLTMKEQIVFASLMGLSGIKDTGTTRPTSGGKPTLSEKYWEPAKVGDTMIFNQSELNSLFKAYFDKIKAYGDNFDISGSDEEKFLSTVLAESAKNAINRLVWFGDKSVIAAGGTAATITGSTNSNLTVTAATKGAHGNGITFAVASVTATTASITVTGKAVSVSLTAANKAIADLDALIDGNADAAALITVTGTGALAIEAAITLVGGVDGAGLKVGANVKYFDSINGLFKKIKTAVSAGQVKRVAIAKNSNATFALQALAADDAIALFESIWGKADSRLKADGRKVLMVTNSLFENYRQSLQTKGTPYDITLTTEGFSELKWNGVPVRNMETIWDLNNEYFAESEGAVAGLEPHKALLTVPDNIPVGTLNDGDFDTVEAFYDKIKRETYMAYGFTLDAQLLEGYMAVVAY